MNFRKFYLDKSIGFSEKKIINLYYPISQGKIIIIII